MFSSSKATARIPLFDRLIDEHPQEREEKKIKDRLDLEGLKASIQKELRMIFNTRSISTTFKGNSPISGDFGIQEYTYLNPNGKDGMYLIRNLIKSIQLYEPRLLRPAVRILRYDKVYQKIFLEIQGIIQLGEKLERFSFPLDIESQ